jgi:hypothetical protein
MTKVNERHDTKPRCSRPYVIISIAQEFSQDVDCHYPEAAVRFNLQYRHNSLIQNCVADIFGRVRVRGDLDVVAIRFTIEVVRDVRKQEDKPAPKCRS